MRACVRACVRVCVCVVCVILTSCVLYSPPRPIDNIAHIPKLDIIDTHTLEYWAMAHSWRVILVMTS